MLTMTASNVNLGSYFKPKKIQHSCKWSLDTLFYKSSFQLKASLDMLVMGSCTIPTNSINTFNVLLDFLQVLVICLEH